VTDVLVEQKNGTVWITLNRPERRNAYDQSMAVEIARVLESATSARSVVITGSGGSFCAGGSLQQLSTPTLVEMRELYRSSIRLFDAIRSCPRPVIAAVNGPAAGGGNELIVACDLAIATRSSTFGQTGPRVGSSPVTGATNVLGVQIGEKRAKEMSMLCRRYSADDALAMGLINAVVDDDQLERSVFEWCEEIAQLSPRYLEITKISSNIWWNAARDSFSNGIGMLIQAVGSDDMLEGASAFLEKRKPVFRDPQ
jgi:2-ketocyclohexanecarboxyl-CoA hydrolase